MKYFFYLFCLLIPSVWAGQYPTVIPVSEFQHPLYPDHYYIAYYTVVTDVGPGTEVIPPRGYIVTLYARTGDNGETANDVESTAGAGHLTADGVRTLGDYAMDAYNGSSPEAQATGSLPILDAAPDYCMIWAAGPGKVVPWDSLITAGPCLSFPPPTQTCKFVTQEVLLDHGTVTTSTAEGSSAKAQISVQCTAQTDVKFSSVASDNAIYFSDGKTKAEITINNKSLGSKITLAAGASSVEIEDKLSGSFTEGAYTASSVLVMEIY